MVNNNRDLVEEYFKNSEGTVFVEEYITDAGEVGMLIVDEDVFDHHFSCITGERFGKQVCEAYLNINSYNKSKPPKTWKFVKRWLPRDFK